MAKSCSPEIVLPNANLSTVDIDLANKNADSGDGITAVALLKNSHRPDIHITYQRKMRKVADPSTEELISEGADSSVIGQNGIVGSFQDLGKSSLPSCSIDMHEKEVNLRPISTLTTDKLHENVRGGISTLEHAIGNDKISIPNGNGNGNINVAYVEGLHCDAEKVKCQDNTADNGETSATISLKKFCNECVDREKQSVGGDGVDSMTQFSCLDGNAKIENVYINHTMKSQITQRSCRKLLILDVNGLLADIVPIDNVPDRYRVDTISSGKAVFKRPYCDDFLHFCFERFDVGVWSSRTKRNVEFVVEYLMGDNRHKLLFCWDQSHCTNTGLPVVGNNRDKPIILKKLKKLWEMGRPDLPWERGEFDESNTLLLDDSPVKALCNPPNTAIFPFSYAYKNWRDASLGPTGDIRVYLERLSKAENTQKYVAENPFGQRPITERNASWPYYLKVIEAATAMEK